MPLCSLHDCSQQQLCKWLMAVTCRAQQVPGHIWSWRHAQLPQQGRSRFTTSTSPARHSSAWAGICRGSNISTAWPKQPEGSLLISGFIWVSIFWINFIIIPSLGRGCRVVEKMLGFKREKPLQWQMTTSVNAGFSCTARHMARTEGRHDQLLAPASLTPWPPATDKKVEVQSGSPVFSCKNCPSMEESISLVGKETLSGQLCNAQET